MTTGARLALLALVGFGGVVAYQLEALTRPIAIDGPPPIAAATTTKTGFVQPTLADFHVVTERPLFRPDRRPLAIPAPAPIVASAPRAPPPPPPPAVEIVGIVRGGAASTVILRDPTGVVRRVHEGALIDGWTIDAIEENKVILSSQGRVTELRTAARRQGPPGFPVAAPIPGAVGR